MIAFKYTKTDGAEYLSHLDLLRHITRTLRRAGIQVNASEGFHPHPKIYLNNPLGLGIKSTAEFGSADCADVNFAEKFNACSPAGIKCTAYRIFDFNPNYAFTVESCGYFAEGIAKFDAEEYLAQKEITVTDMRGRRVDIRPRIYSLEFNNGGLNFTLGCGENNLRPDLFCKILAEKYGGNAVNITKVASNGKYTF